MLPEAIVGLIPAMITPFLSRRLSLAKIRDLALTSRRVHAEEAKIIGLVDEVTNNAKIDKTVERHISRISRSAPGALETTKRYLDQVAGRDLNLEVEFALATLSDWLGRPGVLEGISCFADGFSPPWFGGEGANKREGCES